MKKRVKKKNAGRDYITAHWLKKEGRMSVNPNKQSNFLAPLRKLNHVNPSKTEKMHRCAERFCIGLGVSNLNASLRRAICNGLGVGNHIFGKHLYLFHVLNAMP